MKYFNEIIDFLMGLKFYCFMFKKKVFYFFRKHYLKILVRLGIRVKIILGAALTSQFGWISTNEEWLNIASDSDWEKIFKNKRIIRGMVAEHVFEHLTESEAKKALFIIKKYLLPGGNIRIAVPDGNNPDAEYRRNVDIGGLGPDASDHKQLYTAESLMNLLNFCGYSATLIEGYTRDGHLVHKSYSIDDGFIKRSRSNSALNGKSYGWNFKDAGTSLIVDGILRE